MKEKIFFICPTLLPPGTGLFQTIPHSQAWRAGLVPGGMVTSKIEPCIKQGSILINTYSPLSPNLDQEKIEFHILFVESPVFFFLWVSQFSLAGLLLQCQPIFLLFVAISSVWRFIQRSLGSARTDKPFIPCTLVALVLWRWEGKMESTPVNTLG